jgi:DNA-directed RNA polymerase alpha subunit
MGLKKFEERNKKIVSRRKHGATYAKITKEFNLSTIYIKGICAKAQRMEDKRVVHDEVVDQVRQALFRRVGDLEWSVRTRNCLANDNIIYLGDLIKQSEYDLLLIPNLGHVCLNEIKEVLATMGLQLTVKRITKVRQGELITCYV